MIRWRWFAAVSGIALLALCCMPVITRAADASQAPVGITLSPTLIEIDLSKDGAKPEFDLTVRNNLPTTETFDTSSLNIAGLNETGGVAFTQPGQSAPRGLSNNLRYQPASLTLKPGESKVIKVTIADTDKLAPGGHYGAAVVSNAEAAQANTNGVSIKQAVTSLVFLSTKSGGVRTVATSAISVPSFGWRLPASVDVVIENTGNTQTAPVGYASIGRKGSVAGQGILNPDRNLILPEQNRIFRVTMSQNSGLRLIGRYEVVVHYQATPDSPEQTANRTFWFVSPWFIVAFILVWTIILSALIGTQRLLRKKQH